MLYKIYLKPGKEKPVLAGHPWIFSGAILRVELVESTEDANPFPACVVYSSENKILAMGYYHPTSDIPIRLLDYGMKELPSSNPEEIIQHIIWIIMERIEKSILRRSDEWSGHGGGRLIHGEGDFLPGLFLDAFGKGVVLIIQTRGMETIRQKIISRIQDLLHADFIFEKRSGRFLKKENLPEKNELISGVMPENLFIEEHGLRYFIHLPEGQKTGFYFDQTRNRLLIRKYSSGKRVVDAFSYNGGFGINALAGGAKEVIFLDASSVALETAKRNIEYNIRENHLPDMQVQFIQEDSFRFFREDKTNADLIILDPPKFAHHASEVTAASRGYKDINLLAMKKITSGGIIFTFSCSSAVDMRLFRQIIFAAAKDAGKQVQILHILSQNDDHPISIYHPEGEYLKGLVLRVD